MDKQRRSLIATVSFHCKNVPMESLSVSPKNGPPACVASRFKV